MEHEVRTDKGSLDERPSEGESAPEPTINTSLEQAIRERDHALSELTSLQLKFGELQTKLWEATEANMTLKRDRQSMSEEIMDLTKALFEEANGMVAAEARARANLEVDRKKLETELKATKEQLSLEKQQLYELRGRLGSDPIDSPPTLATAMFRGFPLIEGPRLSRRDIQPLKTSIDQHNYFNCLLPKHRFSTRDRCDGPAGEIWDRISNNLASHELPEFSRFVERCGSMDAETLLAYPYVKRICETDVVPCLYFEFKPKPFVKRVALAMLKNTCCVEGNPQTLQGLLLGDVGHSRAPSAVSVETPGSMSVGAYPDSPVKSPENGSSMASGLFTKTSPTGGNGSHRLRGIMNQFTTSVTSLPDALLTNINNPNGSGSNSGTPSINSPPTTRFCALCGKSTLHDSNLLQYRVRLCDSEAWMLIDRDCRERLVAAGHFFTFLRHLHCGLYSHRPLLDLFCDLLHFRRHMFYVRLAAGATMFFIQSDLESYLDLIAPQLFDEMDSECETQSLPGALETLSDHGEREYSSTKVITVAEMDRLGVIDDMTTLQLE